MENRYLFRAKRIDNGEWVEGNRIDDGVTGQVFIHAEGNSVNESEKVGEKGCIKFLAFEVEISTICQCTGFYDEDGKKIFENDIVGFIDCTSTENGYSEHYRRGQAAWDEETASFQATERLSAESYEVLNRGCKVIGNIFDTPEMLEEW